MRTSAADIRRLAAKGLSGKEAGRLAVAHLQAVERGQEGLLSATDIEGLRACLRNPSEEADYQRMLGLHLAARLMLSVVSPAVRADLHMTEQDYGQMLSLFLVAAWSTNLYTIPVDLYGAGRAAFGVSALVCSYGVMQALVSKPLGLGIERYGFTPVCLILAALPLAGTLLVYWRVRERPE